MVEKVYNWVNHLRLILIIISVIPAFFSIQNHFWFVLLIAGLLTINQCFHYISIEDRQEPEGQDLYLHRLCFISSIFLITAYLLVTGYWWYCPLYYFIINPHSKKEASTVFFLPIFGCFCIWLPRLTEFADYPQFLMAAFIVLLITVILYFLKKGLKSFLLRDNMLTEQMQITALNELKVINLNRELAIRYQLVDSNARLEERENISRNIHNVVGHTITSAIVSLQAYRVLKNTEPQRAKDKLEGALERMRLALDEIRRAVRVLDLETKEISVKDLQQLMIAELKRFSMDTDLEVFHNLDYFESEHFMDKRDCEFLHSALTECLNNGIRHGNATSFQVFMQCDTNHIGLSVSDNGTGFQQRSKAEQESRFSQGYGIRKMQQYVFEHGGKIKIITDIGFCISIELPMTKSQSQ